LNEWGEIRAVLSNDVIIPRLCVSVRVTRVGAGNNGHEHHGYDGNNHRYDNGNYGHHHRHEHHWHDRHHHGYDGNRHRHHYRYDNGYHHKHPATRGLIA
jgi:hypothetical protein